MRQSKTSKDRIIRLRVKTILDIKQPAKAHRRLEAGHTRKIVLDHTRKRIPEACRRITADRLLCIPIESLATQVIGEPAWLEEI